MPKSPPKPITSWAADDQPREKMQAKGRFSLSNAELMAILIGSGSTEQSAVALCQDILQDVDYDLARLGKLDVADLLKYKGIGMAKAITILAALELGRRRGEEGADKSPQALKSSRDIYACLKPVLQDLDHEQGWIVLLKRNHQLITIKNISVGGRHATIFDQKVIFKLALDHRAASLVLAHNHPSGNLTPSQEDKTITQKIKEGGRLLDITVLDHLIIGDHGYFSFADEGIM